MAAPSCLDHLSSVGPPGSRNTVVQRNLSGPTAFKWSKQSGRVTTCETPSHHARRSAGRSRGGALAPHPSARAARLLGPDDPSEPDRRSRRARLPQHTRRRLVLLLDRVALEPTPPTHPETTRTGHHGWPRFPALRAPPPSMTPRITPGKRVQTPPNNLPGEEDSPKQTITATFTLHASKTTPEQRSLFRGWF